MYHSLEVRVPFLDHRVVEHVLSLDPAHRYRGGPKGIFKRAVKHLVPKRILGKRKQGFGIPFGHYFTGRFWDFLSDVVLHGVPVRAGIVDRGCVEGILREQRSGRGDWTAQLWCLLTLSLWWSHQQEQARIPEGIRLKL
jgi:asparagine synthase (glutamine-hydrolysing)